MQLFSLQDGRGHSQGMEVPPHQGRGVRSPPATGEGTASLQRQELAPGPHPPSTAQASGTSGGRCEGTGGQARLWVPHPWRKRDVDE